MVEIGDRTRRRASEDKEHVLVAARNVIAERGLDQTRLKDISEAAGVSISTLQYAFGSREDLLMAALEQAHLEELGELEKAVGNIEDPRERLHAYINYAIVESGKEQAWRLWLEFWRGAIRSSDLSKLSAEIQGRWLDVLRKIIEDGVREGVFRAVEVDTAADQVLAIIDGLGLAQFVHGGEDQLGWAMKLAEEATSRLLANTA
jgi:AcrR family transcriptional regulator